MDQGEDRPVERMPVIFAAHGAPILLDDPGWMAELAAWARAMPKPASALGAAADARPRVTFPIPGWWMEGAFTRRSVRFDGA